MDAAITRLDRPDLGQRRRDDDDNDQGGNNGRPNIGTIVKAQAEDQEAVDVSRPAAER